MMPALDLGNGHRAEFTTRYGDPEGAEPAGLIHYHPKPAGVECEGDDGMCAGAVTFRGKGDGKRPEWDVESWEPLTLSPSLLCRTCGSHGFIRGGKWVDA
jgi:hypothetical protein